MPETDNAITDLTSGVYRRLYAKFIKGRRINAISLEAEAWFWRIHSVVDDFGNTDGDLPLVHAATSGRRRVTPDQVQKWLSEMESQNLIRFYEAGGDRYIHVVGFMERQPANRSGRRVKHFPEPSCNIDSDGMWNPGESGGIRGHNNNSDSHSDTDTENPPKPPKGGDSAGAAKRERSPKGESAPEGFLKFWDEWPSHFRKKGRSKCLRHWQHHGLESMASVIVAAVRHHKASAQWAKEKGQFIPGPLPWLTDEAWEVPNGALAEQASAESSDWTSPDYVPPPMTAEQEAIVTAPLTEDEL